MFRGYAEKGWRAGMKKTSADIALWLSGRIWGYGRPCLNCPLIDECPRYVSPETCIETLSKHIKEDVDTYDRQSNQSI